MKSVRLALAALTLVVFTSPAFAQKAGVGTWAFTTQGHETPRGLCRFRRTRSTRSCRTGRPMRRRCPVVCLPPKTEPPPP